jgi:hypothetical protein
VVLGLALSLAIASPLVASQEANATDPAILAGFLAVLAIWVSEAGVGMAIGVLSRRFASRLAPGGA